MVIVTGQSLPWPLWVLRAIPQVERAAGFRCVVFLGVAVRLAAIGRGGLCRGERGPAAQLRSASRKIVFRRLRQSGQFSVGDVHFATLVGFKSLSSSPPMAHSAEISVLRVDHFVANTEMGSPAFAGLAFNCPWSSLLSVVRLSPIFADVAGGWQSQVGSKPSVTRCVKTSWSRRVWPRACWRRSAPDCSRRRSRPG